MTGLVLFVSRAPSVSHFSEETMAWSALVVILAAVSFRIPTRIFKFMGGCYVAATTSILCIIELGRHYGKEAG